MACQVKPRKPIVPSHRQITKLESVIPSTVYRDEGCSFCLGNSSKEQGECPIEPSSGERLVHRLLILFFCVGLFSRGLAQEKEKEPAPPPPRDASIDELIKYASAEDTTKRRDAVYEIVRRGEYSEVVVSALAGSTKDQDTQIRIQALMGLARAGKRSEPAMSQILSCLSNRDDQVRYRAAAALGAIGPTTIKPMMELWPSAANNTKIAITQALASIGPAALETQPSLLDAMANGNNGLPRYAAEAIVAICPQDEAIILKVTDLADSVARKVGITALASLPQLSEAGLQKLQSAASDDEAKIREVAIVAIAKSGTPDELKARLIENAMSDPSPSVRAAAMVAIRKARLPAAEFASRIASKLPNADTEATNTILKGLSLIGPPAHVALPAVIEKLVTVAANNLPQSNPETPVIDYEQAALTLASFGASVVPQLLEHIEKSPSIEPILSQALARIGEPAIDSLMLGANSPSELVRLSSTRALGGMRPAKKIVIDRLQTSCTDSAAKVRQMAIESLVSIGREAEPAKDMILKGMDDAESIVRAAAVTSANKFEYNEDQLKSILDRGLTDQSPDVRSRTIAALAEMPKQLHARLDTLARLLADNEPGVRQSAAQALGRVDKKQVNEMLVTACVQALKDSDMTVRSNATEAIRNLGLTDAPILEAMGGNLGDDVDLLRSTLEAIAGFGDKASSLVPSVASLIGHPKVEVRIAALNAIAAIDKDHENLVGRLADALDDKEWEIRRIAGVALGNLGAKSKNAVPKLLRLLSSDEDRDFAAGALREINTAPVEAIPLLLEKLDSEERRTAFFAVTLLGKIGPPAAEALPKLEAMLGKPNADPGRAEFRKKMLIEAIASIKGETK